MGTRGSGGGDAGRVGCVRARPAVVPHLRAALASLPRGARPPRARAGARCSSLLLWWGELTLSSRLGSLTQIRHDKEGESRTGEEAEAWAEPRRGEMPIARLEGSAL